MSFFFGKREAVGSETGRKSSTQRSIHGVHKYSGRQLPPFFTFRSDTSPSLDFEYRIFSLMLYLKPLCRAGRDFSPTIASVPAAVL